MNVLLPRDEMEPPFIMKLTPPWLIVQLEIDMAAIAVDAELVSIPNMVLFAIRQLSMSRDAIALEVDPTDIPPPPFPLAELFRIAAIAMVTLSASTSSPFPLLPSK